MALTRGAKLIHLRAFLDQHVDRAAWPRITEELTAEERLLAEDVDAASWVAQPLVSRLRRAAWERYDDSGAMIRALGRFEAGREYATSSRWYLPLIDPLYAVEHMDLYWRRNHDTGHWTSASQDKEIVAAISDYEDVEPASCLRTLGFLDQTMDGFGFEVAALDHPECRARGHAQCLFRARLARAPRHPRRPAIRVTRAEIGHVGRELMHLPTPEGLADAVVGLLRGYLGYERVLLWHDAGGREGLRLMRAAGDAGVRTTRCLVLESAGQVVGRLELGRERACGSSAETEMLEQLMPCIAAAFARRFGDLGGDAGEVASARSPRARFAARLASARARWGLTRRQSEVLGHLVCGQTNHAISAALGCSEGTVELHVTQVLKKCAADNRTMLAARFWSDLGDPTTLLDG